MLIESRPTADPRSCDLLETRVGQPLSMADVRESITHLYSLGRFQDVQVDASPSPSGGVSLRYKLMPIHSVSEVDFAGALALSKSTLRQRDDRALRRDAPRLAAPRKSCACSNRSIATAAT